MVRRFVGEDAASTERYRSEILGKRKSVFDLLEEFPGCELPLHVYLEMLSLLAPRYYSISSSPSLDGSRCSVTVAVVEGQAASGRGILADESQEFWLRHRTSRVFRHDLDLLAGRHLLQFDEFRQQPPDRDRFSSGQLRAPALGHL